MGPSRTARPSNTAELWLDDLLRASSDLILIAAADGGIQQVNPAFCTTLGYGEEELNGLDPLILVAPEDQPFWRELRAELPQAGGSQAIQLKLLPQQGAAICCSGSVALWQDPGGPPRLRLVLRPEGQCDANLTQLEGLVAQRTSELQRHQLLLSEAQRIAKVGSWRLDLREGELVWSDEIYRIFELDPHVFQPSYETFLDCVHPADRNLVDQAYSQSLIDQQPYAVTHRLRMPDGRIKIISERGETSFSDDGEPLVSIGTALDITEATEAREQLVRSEQKLRSLVELAPMGITLSDLSGRILDCNPSFRAMVGARPGQTPHLDFSALKTTAPSSGDSPLVQQLVRLDDHTPVDVRIHTVLVRDVEAQPLVWSIIENISESLQIQDQLEQAASVFSHSQEGIMITDRSGKILDVNRALCQITGYRREQLLGSNPRRLKSGLHDPQFYAEMWQELTRTGCWSGEVINRARDGTLLPVRETISAVHGSDGRVRRYVALLTDIRELKAQQQQLKQLALKDPLTGLANRALLQHRLQQAILQTARKADGDLVLGLLDLDGFKQVNDQHGHEAGDHLLKVLAERMGEQLRGCDTLARLGGDEFVVLLQGVTTGEQACRVVERVLAVVSEPVSWQGHGLRVSASIGLTRLRPDQGPVDPMTLLRQADEAMYAAKRERANSGTAVSPQA